VHVNLYHSEKLEGFPDDRNFAWWARIFPFRRRTSVRCNPRVKTAHFFNVRNPTSLHGYAVFFPYVRLNLFIRSHDNRLYLIHKPLFYGSAPKPPVESLNGPCFVAGWIVSRLADYTIEFVNLNETISKFVDIG